MQAGEAFAGRFVVERLAGRGGMGSVYRATDSQTGRLVALKLLHGAAPELRLRFLREAQVLASLDHPGIVRHVAHGEQDGELFLAMEWLEGEDVSERLRGAGLAPAETVELARAVAEVLQVAHAHGVVHRDIKPSNLFLVAKDPRQVKVLDFGIARLTAQPGHASTRTGTMLGTPGYMAPEQARGLRDVDGRADLFSLGCVIFECLTGWAPFSAAHDVAVLAKILLDEPPRLSTYRADLPMTVDELVASLLAKDPAKRPASAQVLVERIRSLGPLRPQGAVFAAARPADAITGDEQRLFSVVLAGEAEALSGELVTEAPSEERNTEVPTGIADTRVPQSNTAQLHPMREAIEELGGALEILGPRTFVVSLVGHGVATDQAERAARCGLAVRAHLPELQVAVATGRGAAGARIPVGEVIDRAAAVLRRRAPPDLTRKGAPAPVHLDALTAGLLGPAFDWVASPEGGWLHGEGQLVQGGRTLLGKPTPCVGRERELARLLSLVEESVEDGAARAVLVTAGPGVGKSRLRDELLRALPQRLPELRVWSGRADPMRAGSPYHLLGQIVRAAAGVRADAPVAERREALAAHVRGRVGPEAPRVAAFLGELASLPFDDAGDVQLRAARRDPQLMADQVSRAFEDWLRAELRAGPALLVLDDLHWGDWPTVRLLDGALRRLQDAPLAVLALARPAVHELFPKLWEERGVEELRLRELSKRAGEQLVRATLPEVSDAEVARLVAQSEGNAFFLEELIRAAAAGQREGLPPTVLAMAQARLEALDPLCRRALRAASIFGRLFWRAGVVALCGGNAEAGPIGSALETLCEREVVERMGTVRFAGEEAYSFRHGLLQEAAHHMLTETDRALGHRLAGAWLAARGEPDPLVLAEHAAQGGDPAAALELFHRAADDALSANDLVGAVERAERAIACGARGERLGRLRLVQAEANQWRGEQEAALHCAEVALAALRHGSEPWCRAALEAANAWSRKGDVAKLLALAEDVAKLAEQPPDPHAYVICAAQLAWPVFNAGNARVGHALLDAAGDVADTLTQSDARLRAAKHYAGATRAMLAGHTEDQIAHESGSVAAHLELGDARRACESRGYLGYALMIIGAFDEAAEVLTAAAAEAERLGLATQLVSARQNLGVSLAAQGNLARGRELLEACAAEFKRLGNSRMLGGTHIYLAQVDLWRGELALAEQEADLAASLLRERPALLCGALATRADVLLARGEVAAARAVAVQAAEILTREREVEENEALIRAVDAETALRAGDPLYAVAAMKEAVARLDLRLSKIQDPKRRAAFERIREHVRTRALARELGLS